MNRHWWTEEAAILRELHSGEMKRGDAAAGWILAAILGIAGAVVLAHWLAS